MNARGSIGKAVRLYNHGVQLRARWKRTPKAKRLELIADLADVVRSKLVQTGTHTKGRRSGA